MWKEFLQKEICLIYLLSILCFYPFSLQRVFFVSEVEDLHLKCMLRTWFSAEILFKLSARMTKFQMDFCRNFHYPRLQSTILICGNKLNRIVNNVCRNLCKNSLHKEIFCLQAFMITEIFACVIIHLFLQEVFFMWDN